MGCPVTHSRVSSVDTERFGPANPWVLVAGTVVLWVALCVSVEVVLFDGEPVGAVVPGAAGGLAYGFLTVALRRAGERRDG
jgi:hypothetical protein